jgi:medium-chain acyl-[acyl-carrier-protein] hydrolase
MAQADRLLPDPADHAVEFFRQEPLRSRRQIWCFPHGGAGAGEFAAWPDSAGPEALICALRLPGREWRLGEPLVTDMQVLSRMLAATISPLIQPGAIFYGQCLGAVVAFETAAELERAGSLLPSRLIVASQAPPRDQPVAAIERVGSLDDEQLRKAVADIGGVPADIIGSDVLWEVMAPIMRADLELIENHVHISAPIGVSITAVMGSADALISADELQAWRSHTRAGFDLRILNGSHFLSRSSPDLIREMLTF